MTTTTDARTQAAAAVLTQVIQGMCYYPCAITLRQPDDINAFHRLVIRPNMGDFRIVCGRGGRQIKAIEFLGRLAGLQVFLEESREGRPEKRDFVQRPDFDLAPVLALLAQLDTIFLGRRLEWLSERVVDRWILRPLDPLTEEETDIVDAFTDLLWPWGFRNGALIDIKIRRPNSQAA